MFLSTSHIQRTHNTYSYNRARGEASVELNPTPYTLHPKPYTHDTYTYNRARGEGSVELICDAKNGLLQAEAVDAGKTHTSILFELAQQQRWIDPTWGEFTSIGVYLYPCLLVCETLMPLASVSLRVRVKMRLRVKMGLRERDEKQTAKRER